MAHQTSILMFVLCGIIDCEIMNVEVLCGAMNCNYLSHQYETTITISCVVSFFSMILFKLLYGASSDWLSVTPCLFKVIRRLLILPSQSVQSYVKNDLNQKTNLAHFKISIKGWEMMDCYTASVFLDYSPLAPKTGTWEIAPHVLPHGWKEPV